MTTAADTKARVLAYIKRNYFVSENVIARALDLPVLDVLDALLELERTDADVITRDSVIGYIGHTDRIDKPLGRITDDGNSEGQAQFARDAALGVIR